MATDPTAGQRAPSRRVWRALNSPLRVRFHVLIVIWVVVALLAVWVEGVDAGDDARGRGAREYQDRAAAAAAGVAARMAPITASIAPADDLVDHGHEPKQLCDIMSRAPQRPYQRLYVFTPAGVLLCFTVPGVHDRPAVVSQRAYFQAALATGKDQVGGPLVEESSGRLSVLFAHPVRSGGGGMAAVVVAAVDAAVLFDPVLAVAGSDRSLVFGREGGWFEVGSEDATAPPRDVGAAAVRSLANRTPCPVMVAGSAAWTCSPVVGYGLAIATGHPEAAVFAAVPETAAKTRYRMAGVVAVAVLAAFVSDFLFLRRIRLAYGHAGLAGLGAGDTAKRDEIDALGDWARTARAEIDRLRLEADAQDRRRLNSERDLLTSIAETVEIRYPFLRNHGDRVGRYARQIGARLGIGGGDLDLLEFAARVHDLGKIAIADAVYLKPGRLEPIEAAQMQLHAARGGEIAGRMRNVPPEVAEAIRHHHERWDGTGYPDGLAGTEIPFWSRVIAVADAYDAMTEERPYRDQPRTHDETVRILRDGAGSQWDTAAVHAFLEVLESGSVPPKPVSISVRRSASDG